MGNYSELIEKLNQKGFHASYFEDVDSARDYVLSLTEDAQTIGMGGSMTLQESGIFDAIATSGKTVYSGELEKRKEHPDLTGAYRNGLFSDCYLTSTNALTLQGDLINIDGRGNRVAAMFFGPGRVIVVCGTNKITMGPHDAIKRIKNIATPKNVRRLGLHAPCGETDKCSECKHPDRICRVTVRMQYPPKDMDIHIVLIDKELGY